MTGRKRAFASLRWDDLTGEGSVVFARDFAARDALSRADALQDVIGDLTKAYDEARADMARKYGEAAK